MASAEFRTASFHAAAFRRLESTHSDSTNAHSITTSSESIHHPKNGDSITVDAVGQSIRAADASPIAIQNIRHRADERVNGFVSLASNLRHKEMARARHGLTRHRAASSDLADRRAHSRELRELRLLASSHRERHRGDGVRIEQRMSDDARRHAVRAVIDIAQGCSQERQRRWRRALSGMNGAKENG